MILEEKHGLIDCWFDWLVGWLDDLLVDWLMDRLVGGFDWLVDERLVD